MFSCSQMLILLHEFGFSKLPIVRGGAGDCGLWWALCVGWLMNRSGGLANSLRFHKRILIKQHA